MKIDGFSSEVLRLLYGEKSEVNREGKAERRKSSSQDVSVEISKEVLNLSPQEISREKVERIKEAIKSGNYEVNPHRISEALIREILGDDL
ncbi:MAG: flagellar biosynthesis anti-sigma factor FlgM [Desulfurobacteriaceae bacterium]